MTRIILSKILSYCGVYLKDLPIKYIRCSTFYRPRKYVIVTLKKNKNETLFNNLKIRFDSLPSSNNFKALRIIDGEERLIYNIMYGHETCIALVIDII